MFGLLKALFKSNELKFKVIDKVWISVNSKRNACTAMAHADPQCIFIAWFDDTYKVLRQLLGEEKVILAENATEELLQGKRVIFAEHHPLSRKENLLFKALNLTEVPVLSSLDEPFFMWFGGAKTLELMKKLGMNEDEIIGSNLITKAIQNTHQKIEKQVVVERHASSQQEWIMLNLSANNLLVS